MSLFHVVIADYTAATFGHEAARARSVVRVQVHEAARRAVHAALDISMFIRTRKPQGQIFYLGSIPKYVTFPPHRKLRRDLRLDSILRT